MKVFSIILCRYPIRGGGKPLVVCTAFEMSGFSILSRGSAKEWMVFAAKTIIENTSPGTRQCIEEQERQGKLNVYVRRDGLSGVVITDLEYPPRVAMTCLDQIMNDYSKKFADRMDSMVEPGAKLPAFPQIEDYLNRFQNPSEGDKVQKVLAEVEEVKIIMHNNIESALKNQTSLEYLVDATDDLSKASKVFYKQAKKANRCCRLM